MNTTTKTFKTPPAGTVPRLGNPLDKHTYQVIVGGGWHVLVDANTSVQATGIAERCGYTVQNISRMD
jgi:hypothetical protein